MTERQSKLIKLVNLYQKIEVSRLAELLDVSQVTIRKDLDHLEEEGLLSREHGYALIKNANDINTRLTINYDKKLEIATKAAEMVSNGETVMLESGSTCCDKGVIELFDGDWLDQAADEIEGALKVEQA